MPQGADPLSDTLFCRSCLGLLAYRRSAEASCSMVEKDLVCDATGNRRKHLLAVLVWSPPQLSVPSSCTAACQQTMKACNFHRAQV